MLSPMTKTEVSTAGAGEAGVKGSDEAVINEALRLIDGGLLDLMHRELVSTDEVSDLLLDVRMLLMAAELATGKHNAAGASVSA